jgi:anti-sigma regulatory factor (Ser/Thr protein kinase)
VKPAPLQVEATLAALPEIRAFVTRAAESAGLDRRAAYRLCLAVDEIATNIVIHGQPSAGGAVSVIGVDATVSGARLTVVVEDDGPAFDPLAREVPTADDLKRPVGDRPIGGLGVFLAIRGVDEFRYERDANANRNVFMIRLPSSVSPAPAS